jgi:spermidine synthase
MLAWELVDSAEIAGAASAAGPSVMALMRRGRELVIRVDGRELMGSAVHASEDALADLTCARLADPGRARVLVGGLGMGFTLAAALRGVGQGGRVVVAELVPAVVRWNRGPLAAVAGNPLADPRAEVFEGDVADLLRRPAARWDAILLDVDNGPSGLTRPANDWLYSPAGLDTARAALADGGVLGVWSAFPDARFTRRMRRAGFDVEVVEERARGVKGGRRHFIWLGRAGDRAPLGRAPRVGRPRR